MAKWWPGASTQVVHDKICRVRAAVCYAYLGYVLLQGSAAR